MTIDVKGRPITIDDELVTRYERMGVGDVDELYVLSNLGVIYGQELDDIYDSIPDDTIKSIVEAAIVEELKF